MAAATYRGWLRSWLVRLVFAFGLVLACVLGRGEPDRAAAAFLDGEQFTTSDILVTGICNAAGPSAFTFEATGTATGPYPGIFTETGSFTLLNGTLITAFSASFDIVDPSGNLLVSGTKSLLNPMSGQSCVPGTRSSVQLNLVELTYEATLWASNLTESGNALVSLSAITGIPGGNMSEFFLVSTTPSPTNTPTNTPTSTPTNTATATATATGTPTSTATNTPTSTPTSTSTNTPTGTPTGTPTQTPTSTATHTATAMPTDTPTDTPTAIRTNTPSATATATIDQTVAVLPNTGASGGGAGTGSALGLLAVLLLLSSIVFARLRRTRG